MQYRETSPQSAFQIERWLGGLFLTRWIYWNTGLSSAGSHGDRGRRVTTSRDWSPSRVPPDGVAPNAKRKVTRDAVFDRHAQVLDRW